MYKICPQKGGGVVRPLRPPLSYTLDYYSLSSFLDVRSSDRELMFHLVFVDSSVFNVYLSRQQF